MRKLIFKFTIGTLGLFILLLIGDYIYRHNSSFVLYNLNNKEITLNNQNPIFIFYTTDCDECHALLEKINQQPNKFPLNQIYFINDSEYASEVPLFIKKNKLLRLQNNFLINKNNSFENYFNIGFQRKYPSIYIADIKNKTLKSLEYPDIIK